MIELSRLAHGAMGMSIVRNPENSVRTIHAALGAGITLFNTGRFYNGGESEQVSGNKGKTTCLPVCFVFFAKSTCE